MHYYPEHSPYDERNLEQQTLDALLRLEELLKQFLILLPVPATETKSGKRK